MENSSSREEIGEERLPFMKNVAMKLAHEIRNPLMAVRGYLQYLLEETDSEKADIFLNILLPELDRMDRFIEDFLLFSTSCIPQKQYILTNSFIQRFQHLISTEVVSQQIDIMLDLSPDLNKYLIEIDPKQMLHVMFALFANSVEAKERNTMLITIQTRFYNGKAYIRFKDNGRGMNAAVLSCVFDPFFSTKKVGMGIGLPIARKIVTMHGGSMNIHSIQGRGTAVTLVLPCIQKF
jgi:signal transduction histidine kinase